jgi:hypothetical protein
MVQSRRLEQFQQKCMAVLRPGLRKNKQIEHFRDSGKNGKAPASPPSLLPEGGAAKRCPFHFLSTAI